jgi:hypothetical protein
MKRLWVDDVRPPPQPGWEWARTNTQAKELLATGEVVECSLDHDMGLHDIEVPDPAIDPDAFLDAVCKAGVAEETGYDLVCWMIENEHVPYRVTIHSWNPGGAANMASRLNYYGYDCYITPYKIPKRGTPQ